MRKPGNAAILFEENVGKEDGAGRSEYSHILFFVYPIVSDLVMGHHMLAKEIKLWELLPFVRLVIFVVENGNILCV